MNGKALPLDFQGAIAEFEASREAITSFRNEKANRKVLDTHDRLREEYNDALTKVKQAYKSHYETIGKKHGDFMAIVSRELDVEKLMALMGPTVDPIVSTKYVVDRKEYDKAVAKGIIPPEVVEQVEYEKAPSIRGPKEA